MEGELVQVWVFGPEEEIREYNPGRILSFLGINTVSGSVTLLSINQLMIGQFIYRRTAINLIG